MTCATYVDSDQPVHQSSQIIVFAESSGYPFKNIFDYTTAGDWDCVAAVERLPALHYSVDFIFLSVGIMGFNVELETIRGSLMSLNGRN